MRLQRIPSGREVIRHYLTALHRMEQGIGPQGEIAMKRASRGNHPCTGVIFTGRLNANVVHVAGSCSIFGQYEQATEGIIPQLCFVARTLFPASTHLLNRASKQQSIAHKGG